MKDSRASCRTKKVTATVDQKTVPNASRSRMGCWLDSTIGGLPSGLPEPGARLPIRLCSGGRAGATPGKVPIGKALIPGRDEHARPGILRFGRPGRLYPGSQYL